MEGITITNAVKAQFDERIEFLKTRIDALHKEFPQVKKSGDTIRNFDWKTQMLCHRNELSLRENILEGAKIID